MAEARKGLFDSLCKAWKLYMVAPSTSLPCVTAQMTHKCTQVHTVCFVGKCSLQFLNMQRPAPGSQPQCSTQYFAQPSM